MTFKNRSTNSLTDSDRWSGSSTGSSSDPSKHGNNFDPPACGTTASGSNSNSHNISSSSGSRSRLPSSRHRRVHVANSASMTIPERSSMKLSERSASHRDISGGHRRSLKDGSHRDSYRESGGGGAGGGRESYREREKERGSGSSGDKERGSGGGSGRGERTERSERNERDHASRKMSSTSYTSTSSSRRQQQDPNRSSGSRPSERVKESNNANDSSRRTTSGRRSSRRPSDHPTSSSSSGRKQAPQDAPPSLTSSTTSSSSTESKDSKVNNNASNSSSAIAAAAAATSAAAQATMEKYKQLYESILQDPESAFLFMDAERDGVKDGSSTSNNNNNNSNSNHNNSASNVSYTCSDGSASQMLVPTHSGSRDNQDYHNHDPRDINHDSKSTMSGNELPITGKEDASIMDGGLQVNVDDIIEGLHLQDLLNNASDASLPVVDGSSVQSVLSDPNGPYYTNSSSSREEARLVRFTPSKKRGGFLSKNSSIAEEPDSYNHNNNNNNNNSSNGRNSPDKSDKNDKPDKHDKPRAQSPFNRGLKVFRAPSSGDSVGSSSSRRSNRSNRSSRSDKSSSRSLSASGGGSGRDGGRDGRSNRDNRDRDSTDRGGSSSSRRPSHRRQSSSGGNSLAGSEPGSCYDDNNSQYERDSGDVVGDLQGQYNGQQQGGMVTDGKKGKKGLFGKVKKFAVGVTKKFGTGSGVRKFKVGDKARYTPGKIKDSFETLEYQGKDPTVEVEIVSVHIDAVLEMPYYTIQLPDGSRKQTDYAHLLPYEEYNKMVHNFQQHGSYGGGGNDDRSHRSSSRHRASSRSRSSSRRRSSRYDNDDSSVRSDKSFASRRDSSSRSRGQQRSDESRSPSPPRKAGGSSSRSSKNRASSRSKPNNERSPSPTSSSRNRSGGGVGGRSQSSARQSSRSRGGGGGGDRTRDDEESDRRASSRGRNHPPPPSHSSRRVSSKNENSSSFSSSRGGAGGSSGLDTSERSDKSSSSSARPRSKSFHNEDYVPSSSSSSSRNNNRESTSSSSHRIPPNAKLEPTRSSRRVRDGSNRSSFRQSRHEEEPEDYSPRFDDYQSIRPRVDAMRGGGGGGHSCSSSNNGSGSSNHNKLDKKISNGKVAAIIESGKISLSSKNSSSFALEAAALAVGVRRKSLNASSSSSITPPLPMSTVSDQNRSSASLSVGKLTKNAENAKRSDALVASTSHSMKHLHKDDCSIETSRGRSKHHCSSSGGSVVSCRSLSTGAKHSKWQNSKVGTDGSCPKGTCDKCDGAHLSCHCPNYPKDREKHKDAWSNYGNRSKSQQQQKTKMMGEDGGNFVLKQKSVKLVAQPADGSCLFHSLVYCLKSLIESGNEKASSSSLAALNAKNLRKRIASYVAANPDLPIADDPLKEWVLWDSGKSVQDYASEMAVGGWGGGVEIAACSHLYNVNIHVYETKSSLSSGYARISCFNVPSNKAKKTLHILYQGRNHYDALVPCSRSKE